MKKQTLRLNFKKKRSAFSDGKVQDLSIDIANQVLKLNIWDYNNFHVFFPIEKNNEIDKIKSTIKTDYIDVPNSLWQLGHKNPGSTDNSNENFVLQPPIQGK